VSSERARVLIVNADDLGRTSGINAGVFEAHERGLVTSATLMVGFAAAAEASAELDDHPGLGIGLHMALTGSPPVLPPERLPSLTDKEGRLPRGPEGLGSADPKEILAEARAQLQRFVELTGRLPTHLDSHHHAHRDPAVYLALLELAREHHLPIRLASPEMGPRLAQDGVATTDFFVEDFFGDDARLDALLDILGQIRPGSTELMCHPARVCDELRQTSTYADERARELQILTHPDAVRAVRELGIELANFGTAWKA
jgi:predicted glycoside hydrolase/deacetylase ChbG (UPF0249 family)